ncbi:MAG: PepSY domain-containing protein [archaeon]|nr:PepSY domain-containing protein [archaeon]
MNQLDNSNIIISIIIVLCIAAGVTAYSLTNDDNVFTDLEGITPDSGDDGGLGDNGVGNTTGDIGTSVESSGSGSGSGGGNVHPKPNPKPTPNYISKSKAMGIASSCVEQPGCSVKTASLSGGSYYCYVYDADGNQVDCIVIDAKTGAVLGRG